MSYYGMLIVLTYILMSVYGSYSIVDVTITPDKKSLHHICPHLMHAQIQCIYLFIFHRSIQFPAGMDKK
jgi:hypothetical protein